MYGVALKMIHDRDAVCDILQDVFIYYFEKSHNGTKIDKPHSWLMRATINKCIDYSTDKKKLTKIDHIEPTPVVETVMEKKQEQALIKTALSKLKPAERTLAILYSEGMSYKEISDISGIKYSSVGKMLSRTIKKLDGILNKLDYEMY